MVVDVFRRRPVGATSVRMDRRTNGSEIMRNILAAATALATIAFGGGAQAQQQQKIVCKSMLVATSLEKAIQTGSTERIKAAFDVAAMRKDCGVLPPEVKAVVIDENELFGYAKIAIYRENGRLEEAFAPYTVARNGAFVQ